VGVSEGSQEGSSEKCASLLTDPERRTVAVKIHRQGAYHCFVGGSEEKKCKNGQLARKLKRGKSEKGKAGVRGIEMYFYSDAPFHHAKRPSELAGNSSGGKKKVLRKDRPGGMMVRSVRIRRNTCLRASNAVKRKSQLVKARVAEIR